VEGLYGTDEKEQCKLTKKIINADTINCTARHTALNKTSPSGTT